MVLKTRAKKRDQFDRDQRGHWRGWLIL